jgi:hypothetical protein
MIVTSTVRAPCRVLRERLSRTRNWDERTPQARADAEGGSVAAQTVVAIPLLIMLPMLIVQVALWAFAAHTAQAAASQALDAARVLSGTSRTGQAEANQILNQLTSGTLHNVHILVQRTARTVSVTITGTTETIVPGMHLSVHAHASGPVEIFTPDTP